MSKLGVGVGEDFPVDEGKRPEDAPAGDNAERGCCGSHRHGSRSERREAWRQWRDQMRAEWREHKQAMHGRYHGRYHGRSEDAEAGPHLHHLVLGGLALIGLAALLGHRHHDN